jgi:hypothetical protein
MPHRRHLFDQPNARNVAAWLATMLALCAGVTAFADPYQQTNLVTDATDPDLLDPWGVSFSATGPFWVSNNVTGTSTVYNSALVKQSLIVSMPAKRAGRRKRL